MQFPDKPATHIPQAFHVMAKPAGAACNLNCAYCFFLKKERLYPASDFRMSDEVHEAYIRQLFAAHQVPEVTVAWQGGEPTLMGLEFFRRSVELQKRRSAPPNPRPFPDIAASASSFSPVTASARKTAASPRPTARRV